jgi:hypothetical protein
MRYFCEVSTHQGKMVPLIYLPYRPNSSHNVFIAQLASKRITRIGGVSDQPSGAYDGRRLPYET